MKERITTLNESFVATVKMSSENGQGSNQGIKYHVLGAYSSYYRNDNIDILLHSRRAAYGPLSLNDTALNVADIAVQFLASGLSVLASIETPYVFAEWDTVKGRLTLARDSSGRASLYYYIDRNNEVVFSDSLSLLLDFYHGPREISPAALDLFLAFGFIPSPHCIYKGIHKVPAGAAVIINKNKSIETVSFLPFGEISDEFTGNPEEVFSEIEERLVNSLKKMTRGFNHVALLLSGGIDSSLLAYYLMKYKIVDFKAICAGSDKDESVQRACRVAQLLKIKHQIVTVPSFSFQSLIDIFSELDEPLADSMVYPLTSLFQKFSTTSDLFLTGIGADSLFSGLNTHLSLDLFLNKETLPQAAVKRLGERPAANVSKMLDLLQTAKDSVLGWTEVFSLIPAGLRQRLFKADYRAETDGGAEFYIRNWFEGSDSFSRRAFRFDAEVPMADSTLQIMQHVAAIAGVCQDTPFLPGSMIGFTRRFPRQLLIRDYLGKAPLRFLIDRYMPSDLWSLPKIGFNMPIDKILEKHQSEVMDILSEDRSGMLDPGFINKWLNDYYGKKQKTYLEVKQIWSALVWILWVQAR